MPAKKKSTTGRKPRKAVVFQNDEPAIPLSNPLTEKALEGGRVVSVAEWQQLVLRQIILTGNPKLDLFYVPGTPEHPTGEPAHPARAWGLPDDAQFEERARSTNGALAAAEVAEAIVRNLEGAARWHEGDASEIAVQLLCQLAAKATAAVHEITRSHPESVKRASRRMNAFPALLSPELREAGDKGLREFIKSRMEPLELAADALTAPLSPFAKKENGPLVKHLCDRFCFVVSVAREEKVQQILNSAPDMKAQWMVEAGMLPELDPRNKETVNGWIDVIRQAIEWATDGDPDRIPALKRLLNFHFYGRDLTDKERAAKPAKDRNKFGKRSTAWWSSIMRPALKKALGKV